MAKRTPHDTHYFIVSATPEQVARGLDMFEKVMLDDADREWFRRKRDREDDIAISWNDGTRETAVWTALVGDGSGAFSTRDLMWSFLAGYFLARGDSFRLE